jgi:hypothetical protein
LAEFNEVISEIPSGIPVLDCGFRIEQAGKARQMVFQNYTRAFKEFADYLLGGDR